MEHPLKGVQFGILRSLPGLLNRDAQPQRRDACSDDGMVVYDHVSVVPDNDFVSTNHRRKCQEGSENKNNFHYLYQYGCSSAISAYRLSRVAILNP